MVEKLGARSTIISAKSIRRPVALPLQRMTAAVATSPLSFSTSNGLRRGQGRQIGLMPRERQWPGGGSGDAVGAGGGGGAEPGWARCGHGHGGGGGRPKKEGRGHGRVPCRGGRRRRGRVLPYNATGRASSLCPKIKVQIPSNSEEILVETGWNHQAISSCGVHRHYLFPWTCLLACFVAPLARVSTPKNQKFMSVVSWSFLEIIKSPSLRDSAGWMLPFF